MTITVAEKTHWKERIAQKIDQAIKTLVEKHDPLFLERIAREAETLAVGSLGGSKHVSDLKSLEAKRLKLEADIGEVEQQLAALAKRSGVKAKPYYYNSRDSVALWNEAVAIRQTTEERKLLAQEPLGQQILTLRGEQESLLDTVWLSTSTSQIRDLWRNVAELLADTPSALQQKVLSRPTLNEDTK